MICSHCKAEIEDGSLYCNHCGKAVQIVPDYNVLEDEVLPAIVFSDSKKNSSSTVRGSKSKGKGHGLFATKSARQVAMLFSAIFIVFVLGLFAIHGYTHSYSFLINEGKSAADSQNFDSAINYYREALTVTDDPGEAYILIAEAQVAAGYSDEAASTLKTLLTDDPENLIAFNILIDLYVETEDMDGLDEMASLAVTDEEKKLVSENLIASPRFSIPGGEFRDDIRLSLSVEGDYEIYYTTDGTAPSLHNGVRFDGTPIDISIGSTEVTAACIRKDGRIGRAVSETYTIIYEAPALPVVSPVGGRLTRETYVTITCNSPDTEIYYTWDGTVPTSSSSRYTAPIPVPEGNSILSVIAIDKHDLISQVLQTNYIYLP